MTNAKSPEKSHILGLFTQCLRVKTSDNWQHFNKIRSDFDWTSHFSPSDPIYFKPASGPQTEIQKSLNWNQQNPSNKNVISQLC